MLVKDYITNDIPVLKSFDTVEYALSLMDDLKLNHLPLLKDSYYHCLLSDKELLAYSDLTAEIGDCVVFAPAIREDGHVHEALSMFAGLGLSILPMVNSDGIYIGALTRNRLIDMIAELCSAGVEGSIIVLEMLPQDYSVSDIARIVESNNAHIQNLFTFVDKATGRMQVTLKLDLEDASPAIRSFERFNYTVLYHFMKAGMVDDLLQQRMNELMHYMNM